MKKLLSITVLMLFFATIAWSLPNNTYTGVGNFEAVVAIPIMVNSPATVALGDVAPGTIRNIPDNTKFMDFDITGALDWSITCNVGLVDVADGCTISGYRWQYYTGGAYVDYTFPAAINIDGTGHAWVRCVVTQVTTDANATAGTRSFQASCTATYNNM